MFFNCLTSQVMERSLTSLSTHILDLVPSQMVQSGQTLTKDGDLDLYVTTVGDTRHYLYINCGGHFREEAMERNCSLETSDKRKLSGMTPNVGDFDQDGFPDIYVTEWLPHSLGKVI